MVILLVSVSLVIRDSISITLLISALYSTLISGNLNPSYVIIHRYFKVSVKSVFLYTLIT